MSLLDLSLLGLLADQPLHGYELSKRLRAQGRGAVSFGALYPALARLDRKGLITSAPGNGTGLPATPMTGSLSAEVARLRRASGGSPTHSKRNRKVYTITDSGCHFLHQLLTTPAEDDRTFAAQIAAAGHLDATERLELFTRRRHVLHDRLRDEEPSGLIDHYRSALRERDRLADEAEIIWLEHLIAAERADNDADAPLAQSDPTPDSSPFPSSTLGADRSVDAAPRTVGGSIP